MLMSLAPVTTEFSQGPRLMGQLDGKDIVVYGRLKRTSVDEFRRHLRKHPTYELLRVLGRVGWSIEGPLAGQVPFTMHGVACISMCAILFSNDHRSSRHPIDAKYLAHLFDLFFHLTDPISEGSGSAEEYMLRAGEHQFIYQGDLLHQLPRMWLILDELWKAVPEAISQVPDPLASFSSLSGLEFEQACIIAFAVAGASQRGELDPFSKYPDGSAKTKLAAAFSERNKRAFLQWVSADYGTVRNKASASKPPSDAYLMYRFNPLRVFPLIRPDVAIEGGTSDTAFLPVWRLLFERVTSGVFHELAEAHNLGNNNNPFRNAFGHVFQAYVGRLLREALTNSDVKPEWKYDLNGRTVDTPDWIVVEGNRAVVIEVKHSALLFETKQWGDLESLRGDLRKSIGTAVRQLATFQSAISNSISGVKSMQGLQLQLVVVTFDRLHYANSVIRDELANVAEELKLSAVPHVHIASAEGFEYLLGACEGKSLFEILDEKRSEESSDRMDFGDWLARRRAPGAPRVANSFLRRRYDEFFAAFGISGIGGRP